MRLDSSNIIWISGYDIFKAKVFLSISILFGNKFLFFLPKVICFYFLLKSMFMKFIHVDIWNCSFSILLLYYIPFSGYTMVNTAFNCYQTVCYLCSAIANLVTLISIEHASDVHLQDFLLGTGSQWQFCPQGTLANVWRQTFCVVSTGNRSGI